MARPTKWRKVEFIPNSRYFTPNQTGRLIEENILRVEEVEALRLKDLEGLDQEQCAEKMEISRQTFQRILNDARRKVADSLVNGKAIRIAGGNYTRNICLVKCLDCGHEWSESYETFEQEDYACIKCNSKKIVCLKDSGRNFCRGHCRRWGRND